MAPGPGTLVRDVILKDGSTLRLRSPRPDDAGDIRAFFDAMEPESRYMRFHGYTRSDTIADYYAQSDGDARVALLGRHGDRIVAVAGYERLRDPAAAEVAFAVADAYQGRGLGTRMLEQLAGHAAENGVRRFDAEVLPDNRRMLGVFRGAGFETRRHGFGEEVVLSLDLRPTDELAARIAGRDHLATVASMRAVLAPRSVAVVGASSEPGSVGGGIFANIVAGGFAGVATPVNRNGGVVRSVRAVPRVSELSEPPELAVLAVPADRVLAAARDAAKAGVKAIVVVASGFAERDDEGRALEEELLEVVRSEGMRLVGPNALGVLSNAGDVRLHATIGPVRVGPGRVAISAQSGALGLALLGHAAASGVGVASFVSLGNRADVSTNDLLEYWEEDDDVAAIMLYVETFGNPRRFSDISQRVSRRKPILAVKGTRRIVGAPSAESHTAAALRGRPMVDALLRQAGIVRCAGTEELFDAAELLAHQPLPAGRCVGVVTNSGGLGTLAADACASRGLTVATLRAETQERVRAGAPGADRTDNPVDMGIGAGPGDYGRAIEALVADDSVDAVLVLYVELSATSPEDVLRAVASASEGGAKPVIASALDADGRPPRDPGAGVPNLRFPEACAAALGHACERAEWLARPLGQRHEPEDVDTEAARARAVEALGGAYSCWLGVAAAEELLGAFGIAVAGGERCAAVGDAVAAAEAAAGPVALKAHFPPPAHASDIDAVLLGLQGESGVRAGWDELERRVHGAGREWDGAVVQPLVGPGADVLVGAIADPQLGPVIALGPGGRQAGLAGDVAFRLAALTDADAAELVASAPGVAAQLAGFRGAPQLDEPALRDLILRFGSLLRAVPELVEVDLNPVRVLPNGCVVLDLRARLERRPGSVRIKTW